MMPFDTLLEGSIQKIKTTNMTNTKTSLVEKVSELLQTSTAEVFRTMFSLETSPLPSDQLELSHRPLVAGSIGFIGEANGIVHVHVSSDFARTLASRMLGMAENEIDGDEMVNDVIGELSNMIVGAVKSQLCDMGNTCVLTIPAIVRGENISVSPTSSTEQSLLGFCCGNNHILIELQMKQST
ncbi:MAG: chemotaxis protein CheX [Verrucomicrobia bacterium]|jgi:chemotaxis protein CheX|nr:MAG: chemotaxis protein CheX [Verrucomicrobiota bacterium]